MKCPLLSKECIKSKCAWWAKFTINDPATQKVDVVEDCLVSQLPGMLIELIKKTDGTAAAMESTRNEFVNKADMSNRILAGMGQLAVKRAEEDLRLADTAGK